MPDRRCPSGSLCSPVRSMCCSSDGGPMGQRSERRRMTTTQQGIHITTATLRPCDPRPLPQSKRVAVCYGSFGSRRYVDSVGVAAGQPGQGAYLLPWEFSTALPSLDKRVLRDCQPFPPHSLLGHWRRSHVEGAIAIVLCMVLLSVAVGSNEGAAARCWCCPCYHPTPCGTRGSNDNTQGA